ncbi:MAG: hypothetical protein KF819_02085 [Labilithrix sp.]|nr:hypothetical protein [Labilithrix sp.]
MIVIAIAIAVGCAESVPSAPTSVSAGVPLATPATTAYVGPPRGFGVLDPRSPLAPDASR